MPSNARITYVIHLRRRKSGNSFPHWDQLCSDPKSQSFVTHPERIIDAALLGDESTSLPGYRINDVRPCRISTLTNLCQTYCCQDQCRFSSTLGAGAWYIRRKPSSPCVVNDLTLYHKSAHQAPHSRKYRIYVDYTMCHLQEWH